MAEKILNLGKKAFTDCEAWANYDVNVMVPHTREGVGRISVALDLGSTYTRSRTFDSVNVKMSEEKQLNSDISLVSDISNILSKNDTLYNNLEFIIKDITEPSVKPNKIFDSEHFVKGALINEVAGVPVTRPSKVSKTKLISTFLNAISSISLEIISSYQNRKLDKGCFHVGLAISLPPADFRSTAVLTAFKNALAGHYHISLPRLGLHMNIKISSEDIYLEKEPNAVLYSLANSNDVLLEATAIGLDGGGKSNDIAFDYEGRINDDVAFTGEFGGNKLIDNIIRSYCKRTGSSKPTSKAVEASLANGILIRAGREEDISEDIKSEKEKMAQLIFNDISNVLDDADTSFEDIEYITFHGRLYRDTKLADGTVLSIRNMIIDIIQKSVGVGNTPKILVVSEDSVITRGVILSLWVNQ